MIAISVRLSLPQPRYSRFHLCTIIPEFRDLVIDDGLSGWAEAIFERRDRLVAYPTRRGMTTSLKNESSYRVAYMDDGSRSSARLLGSLGEIFVQSKVSNSYWRAQGFFRPCYSYRPVGYYSPSLWTHACVFHSGRTLLMSCSTNLHKELIVWSGMQWLNYGKQ